MDLGRRLRGVVVGLSDALAGRGGDVGDQATALADLNRDALTVRLTTSSPAAAQTISRLRTLVLGDPPNLVALQAVVDAADPARTDFTHLAFSTSRPSWRRSEADRGWSTTRARGPRPT